MAVMTQVHAHTDSLIKGIEEYIISDYSYALTWAVKVDYMGNPWQVRLIAASFF